MKKKKRKLIAVFIAARTRRGKQPVPPRGIDDDGHGDNLLTGRLERRSQRNRLPITSVSFIPFLRIWKNVWRLCSCHTISTQRNSRKPDT